MPLVTSESTGRALEIMLVEDSLLDARLTIEALKRCGIFHRLSLFRDGGEAMGFLNRKGVFARAPRPDVNSARLNPTGTSMAWQCSASCEPTECSRTFQWLCSPAAMRAKISSSARPLGVNNYIRKPFNEQKFLAVIRHLKELSLVTEFAAT